MVKPNLFRFCDLNLFQKGIITTTQPIHKMAHCDLSNYNFDESVIKSRCARKIHPMLIARRSLRAMNGQPIDDDLLMTLFEAARWTPSHYNTQNWRFVYAKRDTQYWNDFVDALWEGNQAWAKNAAVLVVAISKKSYVYNGKLIPLPSHSFEVGSAWFSMALEGTARGLVMHAMGGYDMDKARKMVGLPEDDYQVEAMIAIGNPTDATAGESISTRFPVEKLVSEGVFEEKLPTKL